MNILLLGEKSHLLEEYLKEHIINIMCDKIDISSVKEYDFIISFGYRYIISEDIINLFKNKIINLHISLLPYNKGADPNLWSFLENSPKGVTIHFIDKGLDTGDIILQKEVDFAVDNNATLSSTYNILINEIVKLFSDHKDIILSNPESISYKQKGEGSYHRLKDKEPYMHLLNNMWDTKVKDLIGKAYK